MKHSLFVVEGQTEQIFVQKFIEVLAAVGKFHVLLDKLNAGQVLKVSTRGVPLPDATHLIQILNVEGDEKVNSYILENLGTMKAKGVHAVYGLRDRYTGSKRDNSASVEKAKNLASELQDRFEIEVDITVAIEEVEAWFLMVPTFFQKYDVTLTNQRINEILGFDLAYSDVEAIAHPAGTIDQVLRAVGKRYRKRMDDSYKISEALDYEELYLSKIDISKSLNQFVAQLTNSLP